MSEHLSLTPAPEARSAADSFLGSLPALLQNFEIQNSFRMTKHGLFVEENALPRLFEVYQQWLSRTSGEAESRTTEKCRKRFFGTEEPTLYYVLDGNKCLPGFLVKEEVSDPKRSRIPYYQANLLETSESVHPRDPYLGTLDQVKPRITAHEGFVIELYTAKGRIDVSEDALREFASVFRASPRILSKFPEANKALRYVIQPLRLLLDQAHELAPGHHLLIPERLKQKTELSFFRVHGLSLALFQRKKLAGSFSTKGKNLAGFVRREIRALAPLKNEPANIRGIQLDSPKKQCFAKTWSQGISFHIQLRVLILFLQQSERIATVRRKLPAQYSVRELIERFVSLFRHSKPLDEREVLRVLGRRRQALARYRRTGNWIFVIIDKNVIQSCFAVREKTNAASNKERQT